MGTAKDHHRFVEIRDFVLSIDLPLLSVILIRRYIFTLMLS